MKPNTKLNFVDRYLVGDINSVMIGDTAYIDPEIRDTPFKYERICSHEEKHYLTCPFDLINAPASTQRKYERIADRMVAEDALPVERLISLIISGVSTVEEISEEVRLDVEFVDLVLKMYQDIYGYNCHCGDYIVRSFMPISIMKAEDCQYAT